MSDLSDYAAAKAQLAMLGHYLEQRNQIVIDAWRAGITKSDIAHDTGLNRETVGRILCRVDRTAVSISP